MVLFGTGGGGKAGVELSGFWAVERMMMSVNEMGVLLVGR